jgi:hypothetical protein
MSGKSRREIINNGGNYIVFLYQYLSNNRITVKILNPNTRVP